MRLVGVGMVHNEAALIEAFVRHNLTVLDALTVIDHSSQDGTTDILAALQDEGLPLRRVADVGHGSLGDEQITRAAREALAREHADFVLPLDAEDFLKAPSRGRLVQALALVPPDEHAAIDRLSYVPELRDSASSTLRPADLRRRLKDPQRASFTAVIGRAFLEQGQQSYGRRMVIAAAGAEPPRYVRLPREVVALAHRLPRDEWDPAQAGELVDDPVSLNLRLRYVGTDPRGQQTVPTIFPDALPRRSR